MAAILVLAVSGCIVEYAPPVLYVRNETDSPVIVRVESSRLPATREVPPGGLLGVLLPDECLEDGSIVLIMTQDRDLLGRVDQPACPGWLLTVHPDRTLTYEKR